MLFANVGDWSRLVKSPNLDRRLLVVDEVSCKYQSLAFCPAKLEISQHKNDALAF